MAITLNVLRAINGERDYQNTLSSNAMSIGEELLLLEEYVTRARKAWAEDFKQPEIEALHGIRKIAGIAVRCMENHGAPRRC